MSRRLTFRCRRIQGEEVGEQPCRLAEMRPIARPRNGSNVITQIGLSYGESIRASMWHSQSSARHREQCSARVTQTRWPRECARSNSLSTRERNRKEVRMPAHVGRCCAHTITRECPVDCVLQK